MSNSKPETRAHPCNQCDKSFSHQGNLKLHKKTHTLTKQVELHHKSHIDIKKIHSPSKSEQYGNEKIKTASKTDFPVSKYINLDDEKESAILVLKSEKIIVKQNENQESMDKHSQKVNITEPDGKIVYKCALGCNKDYKSAPIFWTHVSQMHKESFLRICPICIKGFVDRRDLARHVTIHDERKFDYSRYMPNKMIGTLSEGSSFEFDGRKVRVDCICDQCGKIFDKPSQKYRHVRSVHAKANKCSIPYCAKSFQRESLLKEHLKQNVCDMDDKKFQCGHCDESFSILEVLKDHGRKHIDKPHRCKTCENRFSSIDSLSLHTYTHTIINGISCDLCDETFDKEYLLRKHKTTFHGHGIQADKLTCTDCGKLCLSTGMLKRHMLKHTKVKNFICNLCGKALAEKKNLEFHMRRHSGEKQYQCDQCESSFFTSSSFRNHKTAKHRKGPEASFLCTYCGISKNSKDKLKHHITLHTGEKRYKCSYCENRFRNYVVRERHEVVHTGVKKFICKYCSKAFSLKTSWKRHTATHTGERRHLCPECSKTFIEPGDVRKHMKVHHKNSPYRRVVKPISSEK